MIVSRYLAHVHISSLRENSCMHKQLPRLTAFYSLPLSMTAVTPACWQTAFRWAPGVWLESAVSHDGSGRHWSCEHWYSLVIIQQTLKWIGTAFVLSNRDCHRLA